MGVEMAWQKRPRVWKVVAGPGVSHINLVIPLDPDTASRVRQANARFRAQAKTAPETEARAFDEIQGDRVLSRWEPCANPDPSDPGFEIPEFLRRT
jgi:hypothetical protein